MTNSGRFEKGHIPWNKNPIKKECKTCNKIFFIPLYRHKSNRGKFCTVKCRRKHKYKLANEITINKDLAELIGVIIGDGCINQSWKRKDYRIQISGNKIEDKEYMEKYLPNLLEKCLKIRKKPYFGKNGAYILQFQSEPFRIFLHNMGVKSPKNKIRIPKIIKQSEKFLKACIKGIADTDFTLIFTKRKKDGPNYYPRIAAGFCSKPLVKDLEESLRKFGFTLNTKYDYIRKDKRGITTTTNLINLDGPYNLKRWLELIGFGNERIITRYLVWKKHGHLKPKSTIVERKALLG
tara:strand:+ start:25 stop:903 length:879 start_codon:yes stop_codon:yes gene_type:complete